MVELSSLPIIGTNSLPQHVLKRLLASSLLAVLDLLHRVGGMFI